MTDTQGQQNTEQSAPGVSGHTPGPWSAEFFGSPRVVALQPNGGYMPVCDLRGWGYLTGGGALGLPQEQAAAIQDANARLIAAAPDLLDACRAAETWLSGWASAEPYLTEIRNAIAKAHSHSEPSS